MKIFWKNSHTFFFPSAAFLLLLSSPAESDLLLFPLLRLSLSSSSPDLLLLLPLTTAPLLLANGEADAERDLTLVLALDLGLLSSGATTESLLLLLLLRLSLFLVMEAEEALEAFSPWRLPRRREREDAPADAERRRLSRPIFKYQQIQHLRTHYYFSTGFLTELTVRIIEAGGRAIPVLYVRTHACRMMTGSEK